MAKHLAEDGYRVAIADIGTCPPQASLQAAIQMDASDERSVEAGFREAEERLGPVRVLVANAGILVTGKNGARVPMTELAVDDWDRTFAVNARGTFLCCREFLRHRNLRPVANGRVITMTSVAAQAGGTRSGAAYAASKAAIIGLTRACAHDAAPLGITANAIAPGLIDAPMLRQTIDRDGFESLVGAIPLGRIGEAGDVAAAAAFLASAESAYITGAVLDVNGGMRMQ